MLKVAVLAGGYTGESVISFKSAEFIYSNLDESKYQLFRVRILKEGWYAEIEGEKYPIEKSDFSFDLNGEKIKFDVVFNTIHGTPGEDGFLQAYFHIVGQAFTGCDFYQAALTFNKKDCLSVLDKYGVPHAKSLYINEEDDIDYSVIAGEVGLPCFVKPNKSGSSLGVSKVNKIEDFEKAFAYAFKEDREVLVESFLDGTEVSSGVINYNGRVQVVGITEIVSENEFFDYNAKYEGASNEITPARIDDKSKEKLEEIAVLAYKSLNITGFCRCDFIIVDGVPNFIEMNTLPGMSPASIFPQQIKFANINISDFFDNEIQFALYRKSPWKE